MKFYSRFRGRRISVFVGDLPIVHQVNSVAVRSQDHLSSETSQIDCL